MKSKSYLFPNHFQKLGWGLFIFSFIFLLLSMYAFNSLKLFSQNDSHYATFFLYLILLFSALFVAFSKEKIEDELIQHIRYSSVVITGYVGFSIYAMYLLIYAFNQSFDFFPQTFLRYFKLVNPVTLFVLYILVFRVRIFVSKREVNNEE